MYIFCERDNVIFFCERYKTIHLMERMLKVNGAPKLFVLTCSFLLHSCVPIGIYMLRWYLSVRASTCLRTVYGGTYILNKPECQVVRIPYVIIMHASVWCYIRR
jgi:hypothetical protein